MVKITHFYADFKGLSRLDFVQLENDRDAFKGVCEELREVVVEVLVDEGEVCFEVVGQLVKVEENFLEVLLD